MSKIDGMLNGMRQKVSLAAMQQGTTAPPSLPLSFYFPPQQMIDYKRVGEQGYILRYLQSVTQKRG